jgi:putative ABC transport system substrate-binding protein
MAQVAEERPDLLLTFSTPTLQAAMRRMRGVPVVFNLVASPEAAKVCTTPGDHLPGFTGVSSVSDYGALAKAIREAFPSARLASGVFCPSEINSEYNRVEMGRALVAVGMEYRPMPADRPSDVPAALDAAIAQRPDVLIALSDNLSSTAMPAVLKASAGARMPLVGFVSDLAEGGALFVLARDFRELGAQGGELAVRVLRGESPDTMPIELPRTTRLIVNEASARALEISLPRALVERADLLIGSEPSPMRTGAPAEGR